MEGSSRELIIDVESDVYDPSDPRWMREVEGLYERLERDASAARRVTPPGAGSKGPGIELVISIAGSAAGQLAAAAILDWLGSYGDRRVKIRRPGGGEGGTLSVQGRATDTATVRDLGSQLEHLAQRKDPTPG